MPGKLEPTESVRLATEQMALVREAGGKVTEPNGKPWNILSKDILASNSSLHEIIQETLS